MTTPHRAIDALIGSTWAIEPDALETILGIAQRANDAPEAVAAKLGRTLENTRTVTERDGTATIPISGPIFRRANLFTEISGATSVQVLAQDIARAAEDPAIRRIVLEIDSPGGQATGIAELASQIRAIEKPTIAYVDGVAASAAYWIAAAADQIISASTAILGSIGVVATYRPEKNGPIKIISSVSPLKHAGPDTEEGRAEAQRIVDDLAAVFVADVATYRGTTPETVAAEFGRGGVLVGAAAVAAGMADRVGTYESLFQPAGTAGSQHPRGNFMAYQDKVNTALGLPAEASAEQAIAAIESATATAASTAKAEAHDNGISQERTRVSGILAAVADKGHARGIADAAISNGLTLEQSAAMIAAAPATLDATADHAAGERAEFRQAWQADAGQQAPTADTATGEAAAAGPQDFDAAVNQLHAGGKSKGEAIKCAARDYPDLHKAYLNRYNAARAGA